MTERPYTILSCASSLDGRIDGTGPERLVLSSRADLDRVDAERARCDAILIGAGTLRRDDPRLRVSARRGADRAERGLAADPLPVVLTRSGDLPADRVLWNGARRALVYCPPTAAAGLRERLGGRAEVAALAGGPEPAAVLADLGGRGVRRLFVEGGQHIHTAFLTAGAADEIQLSIAPLIVGEAGAPRFVGSGAFPQAGRRMRLLETRVLDDSVLLTYCCPRGPEGGSRSAEYDRATAACTGGALRPGRDDGALLRQAIELSRRCPPSASAYSVGAVVVAADGSVLSAGFSRQDGSRVHAEEAALRALPPGAAPQTATLYCSLEPCSERASAPHPCAELIISAGIGRVVVAWREPELFVSRCHGLERLRAAGVEVRELPDYADLARRANSHLPLASAGTGHAAPA